MNKKDKKKRRSLASEFLWYERKNGSFHQRHRLSKKNKEMGILDRECKISTIEDLYFRMYRLNTIKCDTYKEYQLNNTRKKIVNDWLRYKIAYEQSPLPAYTMDDGTLVGRHWDGTPKFSYAEFSEDETRIIIRDSEGNIIDIYGVD